MLIEISYGSQEAFPLEFSQAETGERPLRVKLPRLPRGISHFYVFQNFPHTPL